MKLLSSLTRCHTGLPYRLAGFGALAFLVCVLWGYVIPVEVRALHQNLLKIAVLGWSGMNTTSVALGFAQWAAWGALVGYYFGGPCATCGRGTCAVPPPTHDK